MAEETEMLIEQVKKYLTYENYKNVVKKAETWNEITEELIITNKLYIK